MKNILLPEKSFANIYIPASADIANKSVNIEKTAFPDKDGKAHAMKLNIAIPPANLTAG